jgi:KAP family P-loop domain
MPLQASKSDETWQLIPDQPPADQSADEYDRVPFAAKLVEALEHLPDSSFVVGLEGVWGCGKTAILNFIEDIVAQKPVEQQPIVVKFNPWWFTGREDLTQRFFDAMTGAINQNVEVEKADRKKLVGALQALGRYGVPILKAFLPKDRFENVGEILNTIEALKPFIDDLGLEKAKSLDQLKRIASTELELLKIPIWVILDDVDRLLPQEALEVLTMVRGVGDLPMVRYLLAYDRIQLEARLANAIGGSHDDARDYINKIIQLSFPIPSPANWRLREAVVDGVLQVLGNEQNDLPIRDFLDLTIGTLIRTPRDVKRLINAFGVARSMVGRELNPFDLLRLELLRLEFPQVYEGLPQLKNWLLGMVIPSYLIDNDPTDRVAKAKEYVGSRLKKWASGASGEHVSPLVKQLFPQWLPFAGSVGPMDSQRRICSVDFFDFYFQRGLDDSVLSITEIEKLKDFLDTGNSQEMSHFFVELNNLAVSRSTISRAFLALFWCYDAVRDSNQDQRALTLTDCLLMIGDELGQTKWFINQKSFHICAGNHIAELCLGTGLDHRSTTGKIIFEKLKSGSALITATVASQCVEELKRITSWSHSVTDELEQDIRQALAIRLQNEQDKYLTTPTLVWRMLDGLSWACQDDHTLAKEFAKKLLKQNVMCLILATSNGFSLETLVEADPSRLGGISNPILQKYVDIQSLRLEARKFSQDEQGKQFIEKYLQFLDDRFPLNAMQSSHELTTEVQQ